MLSGVVRERILGGVIEGSFRRKEFRDAEVSVDCGVIAGSGL